MAKAAAIPPSRLERAWRKAKRYAQLIIDEDDGYGVVKLEFKPGDVVVFLETSAKMSTQEEARGAC